MELNLISLLINAAILVGGAFLGVLLGRRSSTANKIVDDIRYRYEREAAELRTELARLKAKASD